MTSGVYKLEFSSGNFYIGKSIDITSRWKQHSDKLKKGTAAKLLQNEYDSYGMPEGYILKECHSDHIDILEACLINRLRPTLNGTYPIDPLSSLDADAFEHFLIYIEDSTIEHLAVIRLLEGKIDRQSNVIDDLNSAYKEAIRVRNELEINTEYENRISELERTVRMKCALVEIYREKIEYLSLPWYKRWFK